jgi:hypothetical protein
MADGTLLFRCLEKRASLELGEHALTGRELAELEFLDDNGRADLELSVFRIAPDDWCAVCVKKMAAAGADPPRYAGGVDVAPIRSDAEPAPEKHPFQLLRECHHVIRFADADEVFRFAEALVKGMRDGTCSVFKRGKSDLRRWLHENKEHPEWVAFFTEASPEWRKFPQVVKTP